MLSTADVESLIASYTTAWGEPDPASRLRLLEAAWADEGIYTDPQSHAVGREALATLIGGGSG
jgi:hypothetical protein